MKIFYRGHAEEEDDCSSTDPVATEDVEINSIRFNRNSRQRLILEWEVYKWQNSSLIF